MSTFHLRIIAYNRIFYDGEAQSITLPALDGSIQILSGHEPYIVAIAEGEVRTVSDTGESISAVCGRGFAEVLADHSVEVLVDTIERPEEIDVRRAREAQERAQEELRQHQSKLEYHQSQAALSRAMARLKEANKYSH